MSESVRVGVIPMSDRYDADDDRWQDAVADLIEDLRVETGALHVERTPVDGMKGSVDELLLTLGSAGVFSAAVDALRIWLARDKTRSITLTYQDRDGTEQHLDVRATHADADTLAPLVNAVADRIAAGP
jgi:hypothetical protein